MPDEQVPFPGYGDQGGQPNPPGGPGVPPYASPGASPAFANPGAPPAGQGAPFWPPAGPATPPGSPGTPAAGPGGPSWPPTGPGAPPAGPGTLPARPGGPASPWPAAGVWAPPAAPPPRRARAVLLGTMAALASALVAGTAGYLIGVQHSRIAAAVRNAGAGLQAAASGPCPAGVTVPAPSATSPAGAALLGRLLPKPAGAKPDPAALKQGVLSLRDYLSELYPQNPAEQQYLTIRCFQAAAHETWVSPGGRIISVWLIRFGTAADARSYTLAVEQADAADPANGDRFAVPGVSDGLGLARPALDKYGNTATRLLGDAGNTSIIIHIFRPAATDNAAAIFLLRAQSARLTGAQA